MTLVEALQRGRVKFQTSDDPSEIRICCPFCSDRGETPDTRFRLGVNINGLAHCFNCGWSGRKAIGYILRRLEVAATEIDGLGDLEPRKPQAPPELPSDFMVLDQVHDGYDRMARRYLLNRGVLPEQIQTKRIGVSYVGRYAYRIVFPVWDGKKLRALVTRDFTGRREPRYLNSTGDKYLYNFSTSKAKVVLVEGIFKALRLEQVAEGYRCMALLGHDITAPQVEQLIRIREARGAVSVLLWPDPDRVGRKGMVKVADVLSEFGFPVEVMLGLKLPADEQAVPSLRMELEQGRRVRWGVAAKCLLTSEGAG